MQQQPFYNGGRTVRYCDFELSSINSIKHRLRRTLLHSINYSIFIFYEKK